MQSRLEPATGTVLLNGRPLADHVPSLLLAAHLYLEGGEPGEARRLLGRLASLPPGVVDQGRLRALEDLLAETEH